MLDPALQEAWILKREHPENDGKAPPSRALEYSLLTGALRHTDVPAVIGTWISKTMMRAVKLVTKGTTSVGGHNTLPMVICLGSTAVRCKVMFDPAAAHSSLSSSDSIAEKGQSISLSKRIHEDQTFHHSSFITRNNSESLADLHQATADSTRYCNDRRRCSENIRYRKA